MGLAVIVQRSTVGSCKTVQARTLSISHHRSLPNQFQQLVLLGAKPVPFPGPSLPSGRFEPNLPICLKEPRPVPCPGGGFVEVGLFHIVGLAEEALLAVDGLRQIGESVDASLRIAQYYGDLARRRGPQCRLI